MLLIQNQITISHEEEPGRALDEEILEEYDEAAAKSDNDDEEEPTNQDHENRLLLNDLATLQFDFLNKNRSTLYSIILAKGPYYY